MKVSVIIEKKINEKTAQLLLLDDSGTLTVKVIYDGIVLSSSAGNSWNNLCDADMKEEYLDMTVEEYIEDILETDKFEKICEDIDWG